ncbi:OmpA family protein [Aquabacterium humicola]|uniref:OmpA family protein n=1 Tax=Aquabacterium humicola TaxID=3237377 RepID=UPI0025430CEA|nr:OmpA family protein [Rubrivivax pictus]
MDKKGRLHGLPRLLAVAALATGALILPMAAAAAPGGARAQADTCGPVTPEARETAFDMEALFPRGGVTLTPTGRARVAAYARALEATEVEVVVIRVPLTAADARAAEDRRLLAQRRAEALRQQLNQQGVARDRIYTEFAGHLPASEPVVLETVGAWLPQQLASARRACSVLA